jgi:hypothetical protein
MPESAIESILTQVNNLSPAEREPLLAALTRTGTERVAPRRSAWGRYAGLVSPVDEFLRLKHEETAREDKGTQG